MAASRKRRGPPVTPRVVANIRAQIDDLCRKHHGFDGHGYVVVNTIGPYDHNPYDYPLPDADFPKVFRALYEAVDFAQKMHKQGLDKLKIDRLDGSVIPRTQVLASQVVWRSWTPGEHGGWARSRTRRPVRRDAGSSSRRQPRPPPLPSAAVRQMTGMLTRAGVPRPASSAARLAAEGIGPAELAFRLKVDARYSWPLPDTPEARAANEHEEEVAMKRMREGSSAAADELVLFADNDGDLYRQSFKPIVENLRKKVAKGKYDPLLAAKLWRYHADRAAQRYVKEFGGGVWHKVFTTADRNEAAVHWERYARHEYLGLASHDRSRQRPAAKRRRAPARRQR